MARMSPPDGPAEHTDLSQEGEMYYLLDQALPYEYTVMHSVSAYFRDEGGRPRLREIDFIIYHKDKGVIFLEAKAGYLDSDGHCWFRGTDGAPMHPGPYEQARNYKFGVIGLEKRLGLGTAQTGFCKKWEAVWLYDYTDVMFDYLNKPPDAIRELTITSDDVKRGLKEKIDAIFALEDANNVHQMTDAQWANYEKKALLTPCNVGSVAQNSFDAADNVLIRLTDMQENLLQYLRFEKRAAISGIGGSGKTVIARKKVQMLAQDGSRVLFLCNTTKLSESLARECRDYDTIEVRTVQGYAMANRCSKRVRRGRRYNTEFDYDKLANKIIDMDADFPFEHVIVDEAQDFGGDIEQSGLLLALESCVKQKNGSMYVFYDEMQAVYKQKFPETIRNYPCKLALYVNCRNTKPIARTALSAALSTHGYTVSEGADGPRPTLYLSDDANKCVEHINRTIAEYIDEGVPEEQIVILSCSSYWESYYRYILSYDGVNNYWPGTSVLFDTVRKFKGLEAKAVIVVDVDGEVWFPTSKTETELDEDGDECEVEYSLEPGILLYTGASRAKRYLDIVCTMTTDQTDAVLSALRFGVDEDGEPKVMKKWQKPAKKLAEELNATLVED